MTEWIVTSSALIVMVILLRRILKGKISLRLQYALWALVLVRLLIPGSLFESPLSVMNAAAVRTAVELEVEAENFALPDLAIVEPDPELPPEEQERQYEENKAQWQAEMKAAREAAGLLAASWDYLELIWYLGIVLVGLALLISNLRFWVRLRRSRTPVEVEGCPRRVYLSGAVETPCLFGLFWPAIYVTEEVLTDKRILCHVCRHELTHHRHGDHLWSLLRCLCLALHWYNPLVWAAACLSRRDCELACDEGALRRMGEEERGDYGRTLIQLTCHTGEGRALLLTATTMTGGVKAIRERVTLIAKKPKMAAYTLVVVVLVAALACACTFTGAKEEPAGGEEVLDHVRPQEVTDVDGMTEEDRQQYIDALEEELQAMQEAYMEERQLGDRPLTEEEIARVNEYLAPTAERDGAVEATVAGCLFTAYFDRPEEIDLSVFLYNFPEGTGATAEEFEALQELENFHYKNTALDNMPVPVHKYPAEGVDAALREYTGIGIGDLTNTDWAESLYYLEEYDAYYNTTSDFGAGVFVCVSGQVEGDTVRLYSQGGGVLTLVWNGERYLIQSFQPVE